MNKKIIGIFLLLVLITFFVGFTGAVENLNKTDNKVYEELKNNETVAVIIKINSSEERGFFGTIDIEDKKEVIKDLIKDKNIGEARDLISAEISERELQELEQNKNIEKILPSHQISAFLQDSVGLVNATLTWAVKTSGVNITGADETICVIDTGINFGHPALTGKNKTCIIDCYNKACVENCSISDDNGHGTHVAGIIAASGSINGVAIGVNLIGVKILDSAGNGHATNAEIDLVNAIDWCVTNRNLYNISVISMSLGTTVLNTSYCDSTFTDTWTKSINNATFFNISVIAATGNSGAVPRNTTAIAAPACIFNVTSVSATDKDDSISSYGHYNSLTDFFAPGTNINSTYNTGGYRVDSGTSMATPHVAGAFALFRQFFRLQNLRVPTPQEIQSNLNSSGKRIDTGSYSIARVNIYSAIENISKSVSVIFSSPANDYYTKQSEINFTCDSTSRNYQLTNITFYLWNSTNNLIYNLKKDITGNTNSSVFNYTLLGEESYLWNCVAYNNQSYSSSNLNFTITYDRTVTNISSVESSSITSSSAAITWTTGENANSSVNYGTTADLGSVTANSSLVTSHSVSITSLSASTIYYYNVTSCDNANNCNTTGTNSFTTSAADVVASSSGGGGGGGTTTTTYVATPEQASAGYNQSLKLNDKIKFSFFDAKSEAHTLTVSQLGDSFVDIIIQSEPIILSLGIGQSAKLNLTDQNYYDLYVKLDSIQNSKASITVQTIHELIPRPTAITGNAVQEDEKQNTENPKKQIATLSSTITSLKKTIYIIVAIFIIIVAFLLLVKTKKTKQNKIKQRQEQLTEHRKKFEQIKPKK